jgi:serine/threonine protein kinase
MSEALRLRLQAALGDAYILDRELSGGGMSRVFLGRDMMLGRQVVLKVLPPEAALPEPAARFRREAMLVARLQHPHILPVFGVGVVDDIQYFTMPYVEGGSLRTHLEQHRHLPVVDARRVLSEIGDALACAHRQGIVHRDVKPENIFLERRTGRTLLADFGVALALEEPEGVTQAGTTVGTPAYMSPEQVDGRQLDGLSDIYSLGLVGWEMVTGQRPWSGDSVYDVMYKQKHEPLPSLDSFNIDVAPSFVRAIERAVRKDPKERWPSAEAFVAALDPGQDRDKMIYPHTGRPAEAAHSRKVDAEPVAADEDAPTIVAHHREAREYPHQPAYQHPHRQHAGMDSQEYEYRARAGWRSSMYGAREQRRPGRSGLGRAVSVAAAVLVIAAAAASATTAGRRMLMAPFSTAAYSSAPAPAPVAASDSPVVAVGKMPVADVAATLTTPAPSARPMTVKALAAAPPVQIVGRLAAVTSPHVAHRTRREYADARPGTSVRARVATAELQLHSYERVMANEPAARGSQGAPVSDHAATGPASATPATPAASVPAASSPKVTTTPVATPSATLPPASSPASSPALPPASTSNPPLAPAIPSTSDASGGETPPAAPSGVSPAARADAVRVPAGSSSATGTKAATLACRPAFPGSHVCRVYDPNTGQVVGYQYIPGETPAAPSP